MMGETINESKQHPRYDPVYEYFSILKERWRQSVGTFSGEQQQMRAIGRGLIGHQDVLLLNELSMEIHPSIIQEIGRVLVKLNQEEGLTTLLVEQNTSLISQVAHRAYAMDKGRSVATLGRETLADRNTLVQYLTI